MIYIHNKNDLFPRAHLSLENMLKISDRWLSNSYDMLHPVIQRFIASYPNTMNKMWLLSDGEIIYSKSNSNTYNLKNLSNNRITDITNLINSQQPVATHWDNVPIWRYIDTFGQNNLYIHREATSFILDKISTSGIICGIGGEFYRYFILSQIRYVAISNSYIGISNNNSILALARFNMDLYHLPITLHHVDYNNTGLWTAVNKNNINQCLINLSTIPIALLKQLAHSGIPSLILIICNQSMFNKRRHILEKEYKLVDYHICGLNRTLSIKPVSIYIYMLIGMSIPI